MEIYMNIF